MGSTLVVSNEEAHRLALAGAVEKKTIKGGVDEKAKTINYAGLENSEVTKIAIERSVAGASKLSRVDLVEILTKLDEEKE